jgi:hypothetical protein
MQSELPTTLAIFADPSWFRNPDESRIWLRLHSVLGIAQSEASEAVRALPTSFDFEGPVALGLGVLGGVRPHRQHLLVTAKDTGEPVINTYLDAFDLPQALYLALATPARVDGVDLPEHLARRRLSLCAGLLAISFGHHFLRDDPFEGLIDVGTGKASFTGPVIRIPQPTDGPFLKAPLIQRMQEIHERLKHRSDDLGQRLRLALHLSDRARSRREGFFYYWSALELVAGGRTGAIRTALAQAYGFRRYPDVDRHLGFGALAQWRHDYYHQGQEVSLHSPVERYLQMMLLELIAHRLGLPVLGLLIAAARSPAWDLAELRLPYSRPDGA